MQSARHFYPRSPCGERLGNVAVGLRTWRFLSTLSLRRATTTCPPSMSSCPHFYPRSPCGERPRGAGGAVQFFSISIHALLAESDSRPPWPRAWLVNFYPRSPCGERRVRGCRSISKSTFLSTLSLRRATYSTTTCSAIVTRFLSTLSLRRATHLVHSGNF